MAENLDSQEAITYRKFLKELEQTSLEELKEAVEESEPAAVDDVKEAASTERAIMVAVDDSEGSKKAFEYALENVVRANSNDVVHLCHHFTVSTYPVGPPAFVPTALKMIQAEKAHHRSLGIQLLKGFARQCEEKQIKWKAHILSGGEVRDAVHEYSKTLKPSIVVVGCRGLGTIKRALLGSLSSYLVHHCECPVLVVR